MDQSRKTTHLHLRRVVWEDAGLLLQWRNDPTTRKASISNHKISTEEHREWLTGILSDKDKQLFIAQIGNSPVGTVRADRTENGWELSWTIAPEARGKGLGKEMVMTLADMIEAPIAARVKKENQASASIARYAGMALTEEKEGVLIFQRGAQQGKASAPAPWSSRFHTCF